MPSLSELYGMTEPSSEKLAIMEAAMGTAANLLWQNLYQLNDKDRIIVDLQRLVAEKDNKIADLTKQLIEEKLKVETLEKNASHPPMGLPREVKMKSEVFSESERSSLSPSLPTPFSITPTWPDPNPNHHEVGTSSDEERGNEVEFTSGNGQMDTVKISSKMQGPATPPPPPPPPMASPTPEETVQDEDTVGNDGQMDTATPPPMASPTVQDEDTLDNGTGKEKPEVASCSENSGSEADVTPLRGCPQGGLLNWRSTEHGRVNRTKEVEDGVVKTWWYCRCGKSFRFASGLTCHVNTREKRWKCVSCDKRHTFYGELAKHLRKVHGVEVQDNFGCHLCGTTFQDRTSLFKHRFTHTVAENTTPETTPSPTSSRKRKKTST